MYTILCYNYLVKQWSIFCRWESTSSLTCDGRTSAWSASPCLLFLFIYQNVWWFTMYFWIQTKKSHSSLGFLGIFPILEGIPALIYKILLISSHSLFSSFVKEVFDDEGLWCWDEKGSSGVVGLPHVTGKRESGKGFWLLNMDSGMKLGNLEMILESEM